MKGPFGSFNIPTKPVAITPVQILRLNPDGVMAGRTRTNLDAVDLNRPRLQFSTAGSLSEASIEWA